jgi:hypothetical protein
MDLATDLRQQARVCTRLAEDCGGDEHLAERLKTMARDLVAKADEHCTPIAAVTQRDEEETMARSNEAAEDDAQNVKQRHLAGMKHIRELNMKLMDMAQANTQVLFNLARQIAAAGELSDVANVWTEYARKQFEMTGEQMRELTAVGQKIAADSTAPIVRDAKRAPKEDR